MQKKDIFFILSFAVISFLVFLPQYISNKIVGWLDMIYYFIPFKEIIVENLKKGILPLWNPYIYCGQPLLANFQSAIFYPLNIFYYVFSIDIAFKINTFIIYFIMSTSIYMLFRQFDLTEEASFISSFLFSFTSYMTIRVSEWADLHTIAWMPAAIYFSRLSLNKNRINDDFFTLVALTMSFLSGHPQVFICMFILFSSLYFYWAGLKGYKKYFTYLLWLIFIAAVQILPTIEFLSLCSRMSKYRMFYDSHSYIYMKFDHLIQIFFPFIKKFFSSESKFINWMGLIDIGIVPLLLGGFAITKMKDIKLKDFLLILFTFSFVFSFFNAIPYYKNIYEKLFFLHFLRYPAKINVIFFFILCFFAGVGFDLLFGNNVRNKKGFLNYIVIINIIFIFGYLFLYYNKIFFLKFYIKKFYPGTSFDGILANVNSYDIFLNDLLIFLVILFLFMIILYIIVQKEINNYIMKIILIVFIIITAYTFNQPSYGHFVKYNDFNGKTEISKFIKNQHNIKNKRILAPLMGRHFSNIMKKKYVTVEEKYDFVRSTLQPNIPIFYRLYNLDGFDSLIIASMYDFIIKINKYKNPWDNSMFSLLSTKYIVANRKIKGKTIKKVFFDKIHNMYLYEKNDVPDIVYFVPLKYAVYVDKKDEEFNELYNSKYNYNRKIVIDRKYEDKFKMYLNSNKVYKKEILSFERKDINSLIIKIKNPTNGFIVISENFYPGWVAKVNGIKKEIIKVNGFLKGIFVESGQHLIELEYKPVILYIGYIISFFMLLYLFVFLFFRKKYEKI